VLVWLNRLPPGPAGTYKAEIYGIAVKGHPGAWAGTASPEPAVLPGRSALRARLSSIRGSAYRENV
jgi:hypothetical protein